MPTINQSFTVRAEAIKSELIKWRRHLHQFPELSFEESETSKYVATILESIPGLNVQTAVGYPTAVVGTLSSGDGPTIAIRADMDALPINEENDCHYKSRNEGVMHACGHDAHTAIVLGVARLLSDSLKKGEWSGTVKFLFQPAEEHVDDRGYSGASYMIQGGALDDVDGVIALHVSPEKRFGEVQIHDGYSMANVDVFDASIYATGGHGAYPHLGTDPFWMLSSVLQTIYGITSRRVPPLAPAVISIGSIHGGKVSNVIPSVVDIKGTIRSYDPEIRKILHQELEKAFSIVVNFGGQYDLKLIQEDPSLYNDEKINKIFRDTIHDLHPDFHILEEPFGLGGEDFSHMTKKVPGAMFFLGCSIEDEKVRNLHTPYFDIDERVLPVGASILAEAAKVFLDEN